MTLDSFSVHLEVDSLPPAEDAIIRLAEGVSRHAGIVAGGPGHTGWAATISVDATDAAAAVSEAERLVTGLAASAGLSGGVLVRAEAVRHDLLDADLARPLRAG